MNVDAMLFRGVERILIVLIGGMCIFFGYRLFRLTVASEGDFAGKGYGFNVSLKRVGPGVFFAFFGAVIMLVAIVNSLHQPGGIASNLTDANAGAVYMSGGDGSNMIDRAKAQRAMWSISTLSSLPPRTDLSEPQLSQSVNAVDALTNFKSDLLACTFGTAKMTLYGKMSAAFNQDPINFKKKYSAAEIATYNDIKSMLGS